MPEEWVTLDRIVKVILFTPLQRFTYIDSSRANGWIWQRRYGDGWTNLKTNATGAEQGKRFRVQMRDGRLPNFMAYMGDPDEEWKGPDTWGS